MSEKKGATGRHEIDIEIDYNHIDVGCIMEKIKSQAALEIRPGQEESPPQSSGSLPPFPEEGEPITEAERSARRSKIKRFLLKLMTPLAPLIKVLILPVYEEQRQLLLSLHNTNKRLDALGSTLNKSREYTKLLHQLAHNLVVEMSKLKIEEEMLKTKIRILEKDFETLTQRERALEKQNLVLLERQERENKS